MSTHTTTDELLTLLADIRRTEERAARRMTEAEEARDAHGGESTALDVARIEHNRAVRDTSREIASQLTAILRADASRHAAISDRMRQEINR